MLKNILGNKDGKKEVDDEELKKLREQFKQLAEDTNPNSGQDNSQSNQQGEQQQGQQNEQNTVAADPQRVEENERVTNLIMQQIKELIEIDNNLNVKIKEIETKLKNNMQATQDVKQVVDKFHQRLEFIEKNMEKFMGLYEVVTNRFNPFVEEEQKEQLDNPQASGNPSIPDVALAEEGKAQSSQKQNSEQNGAQQSGQAGTQSENQQAGPQVQDNVQNTQESQSAGEQTGEQQASTESASQQQTAQKQPSTDEDDDGTKLVRDAGVKGKLDPEPEKFLIQSINRILSTNNPDENTLETLKAEVGKNVNSFVVEAIKGHKKVSTDQIKEMINNLESNLGLGGQASQQQDTATAQNQGTTSQQTQAEQATTTQQEEKAANQQATVEQQVNNQQSNQEQVNQEQQRTTAPEENSNRKAAGHQPEAQEASNEQTAATQQDMAQQQVGQETQNQQDTATQNPGQGPGAQQNPTGQDQQNSVLAQEVPQDYHFTLPDGTEVKSIGDLVTALQKMDDNTLAEHMNEQGNDFGQWLGLVTGDNQLAERFSSLTSREEMISELQNLG